MARANGTGARANAVFARVDVASARANATGAGVDEDFCGFNTNVIKGGANRVDLMRAGS